MVPQPPQMIELLVAAPAPDGSPVARIEEERRDAQPTKNGVLCREISGTAASGDQRIDHVPIDRQRRRSIID